MKKFLALTLTLCLCLSLGVTALAADLPEGWTPADGARTGEDAPLLIAPAPETVDAPISLPILVLDGETVDTTGIPTAPLGYVPMRLLSEANGGSAEWYSEDNQALFFFDENSVIVDFTEMSVRIGAGSDPMEGVKPYLDPAGYTFLPVSVLSAIETVSVNENPEMDVYRFDITTSASDPDKKVVLSIMEAVELGARMKSTPEEMDEYMGIHQENFTKVIGYFPMMINADTIVIGQVAEGKMDAAKEDLEARKQTTIQSFENYLPDPLEMAKNGQIVVAPDGSHIMLIISGDNDKAIEMFNAAYPAAE